MFSRSNSSNFFTSPISFRVLLVDDDFTHLSTVEQILHSFGYQVNQKFYAPATALHALQRNNYMSDIVVCGVSLSDLYCLRLVQFAGLELDIPVLLMNFDSSHEVAYRGILNGASKCLAKPIQPEDLKNIWQIALGKRRNQLALFSAQIHAPVSINSAGPSSEIVGSSAAAIAAAQGGGGEPSCSNPKPNLKKRRNQTSKKPRLNWTNEHHKLFVDAIERLEFGKVVPTKILRYMRNHGLPNITRENVASHLQKYRSYCLRNNDIDGSSKMKLSSQSRISVTNGENSISTFPANQTPMSIKNNSTSSCSTSNLIVPPDETLFLDKNNAELGWDIVLHDQGVIMPTTTDFDQNMNNILKVSHENDIPTIIDEHAQQSQQIVPFGQEKHMFSVDISPTNHQLLHPPTLSDQIFDVDGNNIPIRISDSKDSNSECCFDVLEDYEAMYLNDCGDGLFL